MVESHEVNPPAHEYFTTSALSDAQWVVQGDSPDSEERKENRVWMNNKYCTPCGHWQQTGRLCEHDIAVWYHTHPHHRTAEMISEFIWYMFA
ncbi:hypothetical protein GUITHDRAFT_153061, partial [Guillardia theta CCMP2712]